MPKKKIVSRNTLPLRAFPKKFRLCLVTVFIFYFQKLNFGNIELFSWYDIVEYSLITKIVHPKT